MPQRKTPRTAAFRRAGQDERAHVDAGETQTLDFDPSGTQASRSRADGVEANVRDEQQSRRNFLKHASLGLGLAALNSREVVRAAGVIRSASRDSATITLDAILLYYVAPPLGGGGSSSFAINGDFTFRLKFFSPDLSIPLEMENVSLARGMAERPSTLVPGAVTLSIFGKESAGTPAPAVPGNAAFAGLLSPQLVIHGDESGLLFRMDSLRGDFFAVASALENPTGTGIEMDTAVSMLAQYPLLNDPSGSTLTTPRFIGVDSVAFGPGSALPVSRIISKGSRFSEARSATLTTQIVDSTGFRGSRLNDVFAVGTNIPYLMTPVQETVTRQAGLFTSTLERDSVGITAVYLDRAFKTFVIADKGAV